MKGKIIFVAGAAIGYVFGTRAGRERYEQIKSAAGGLWNSKPVQKRVDQAKDIVSDAVGDVPQRVVKAGRKAVAKLIGGEDEPATPLRSSMAAESAASSTAVKTSSTRTSTAATKSASKTAATRPAAKRTTSKPAASDD